jgi:hypothetical protein
MAKEIKKIKVPPAPRPSIKPNLAEKAKVVNEALDQSAATIRQQVR